MTTNIQPNETGFMYNVEAEAPCANCGAMTTQRIIEDGIPFCSIACTKSIDYDETNGAHTAPQKPEFGQRVKCVAELQRATRNYDRNPDEKYWDRIAKEFDGVFIGFRTLQNGERRWEEYSIDFYPSEYINVYLVAKNTRENPVYVLPEDCTPIPEVEYSGKVQPVTISQFYTGDCDLDGDA